LIVSRAVLTANNTLAGIPINPTAPAADLMNPATLFVFAIIESAATVERDKISDLAATPTEVIAPIVLRTATIARFDAPVTPITPVAIRLSRRDRAVLPIIESAPVAALIVDIILEAIPATDNVLTAVLIEVTNLSALPMMFTAPATPLVKMPALPAKATKP
jgi:hypothetical protein